MSKPVLVEISARHVHVTEKDLETLFGSGYKLKNKKNLSQPGQFASEERVDVVGSKNKLANVSILGPVRTATQVEISATDARSIGIAAPIRESGHIVGSGACKLVGPCGEVELSEGAIVAKRHIHMTPEDAEKYSIKDNQIVRVALNTTERSLVFGDVVARVNPNFKLAMHIDTDEANAASVPGSCTGEILD